QKQLSVQKTHNSIKKNKKPAQKQPKNRVKKQDNIHQHDHEMVKYHSSNITVHTPEEHPESIGFHPTALVAEDRVLTYIAGTPVVTSPYLGARPAFDGSDYLVNISSINRDVRLMQQRRRL